MSQFLLYLGRDEDVLALATLVEPFFQNLSNGRLVAVVKGRVDVPVTVLQSTRYRLVYFVEFDLWVNMNIFFSL